MTKVNELSLLVKLPRKQLAELLISARALIKSYEAKLAIAKTTIAENQQSIESKRKALIRNSKTVRSLRDTVKRRRKSHG